MNVSAKRKEMMKNAEKHSNTAAGVWLQAKGVVESDAPHLEIDCKLMSKAILLCSAATTFF